MFKKSRSAIEKSNKIVFLLHGVLTGTANVTINPIQGLDDHKSLLNKNHRAVIINQNLPVDMIPDGP